MDHCISCYGKSFKINHKIKGRNISECRKCGLISVNPIPSDSQVLNIVKKVSKHFYKEYSNELDSYTEYFIKKAIDINNLTSKGRLVDIGCGPGTFLEIIKKQDWSVLGIDLSAEAVRLCKKKKIKAKLGTTDSLNIKSEKFDVITAFQVIEHIRRPDQFLEQIYNMLKPGGYLVLTTPNQKGFLAKIMGKFWFEYYNLEHLYFFNPAVLHNIVEKAGFKVRSSKIEFGRKLKFSYIIDRLINYYYTSNNFTRRFIIFLQPTIKVFNKMIYIREPWVNIYLVAQKKN